jgi:hypothetical protein
VNGASELRLRSPGSCATGTFDLPIPSDQQVPASLKYQGLSAQRSEQAILDQYGQLLAFLIDGDLYDREGYLFADAARPNCQQCLPPGITQLEAIPIPGDCYKYYLFFSVLGEGELQTSEHFRVYTAILDMAAVNIHFPTDPRRRGAVIDISTAPWGILDYPGTTELIEDVAEELELQQPNDGPYLAGQLGSVDLGHGQDKFLFIISHDLQIDRFQIDTDGISHLGSLPCPVDDPNDPFDLFCDNERRPIGEFEATRQGNLIRTAVNTEGYEEIGNDWYHYHQITQMDFDLQGNLVAQQNYPIAQFALANTPADLGAWSKTPGLEFSPDGHRLYFVKPWYTAANEYMGYIDLVNSSVVPVPSVGPDFRYSELELGPASADPNELSIYAVSLSGELGELAQPNGPNITWDAQAYPLPYGMPCEGVLDAAQVLQAGTTIAPIPHYTLQNQCAGMDPYGQEPEVTCCAAMIDAEGWYFTAAAGIDAWSPGENPFRNTCAPILIRSQLVIPATAKIQAQDLDFRFSADASLIVEPGGSFSCNNCTFTNACPDAQWQGVHVKGTFNQPQGYGNNPAQQGYLSLTDCVVENAVTGILVGTKPPSKKLGGGIVVMNGTTVQNCRTGVDMHPYRNFAVNSNPTAWLRNRSRFTSCTFTVDEDYPVAFDFREHVRLWAVEGIRFLACAFENTVADGFNGIDADNDNVGESDRLGYGIHSLDAEFSVKASCSSIITLGQPCPPQDVLPSRFTGLDHGIHALNSISTRRFSADESLFENNICGVFAQGVPGFSVTSSNFIEGLRTVALTGDIDEQFQTKQRGIYAYESFAFKIWDNELAIDPLATSETEGIVVGYCREHNDAVFRNSATGLTNGYVSEGVNVDPANRTLIGLQFFCNLNNGNTYDIWNRQALGADVSELPVHTMRTVQGAMDRPCDNTFDRNLSAPANSDFPSDCDLNVVNYIFRDPGTSFEPHPDEISAPYIATTEAYTSPSGNCDRLAPLTTDPSEDLEVRIAAWANFRTSAANDYSGVRYLYDQLIDGGSTDLLLLDIQQYWPTEAWTMRTDLLAESPFLTGDVLRGAIEQNIMPQAMVAEVCIANPDATRQEGFVEWLRTEAPDPLPEHMIEQIIASWDQLTYRFMLEQTMGKHHAEMTWATNELLELWQSDTTVHSDSTLAVWSTLYTVAGDYGAALTHVEREELTQAQQLIEDLEVGRRMNARQEAEQQRMLDLIGFVDVLANDERDMSELSGVELAQLEDLTEDAYDRPATWAQNILCFHYGVCRPPLTGGGGDPKALFLGNSQRSKNTALLVYPNPAADFVAIDHDLRNSGVVGDARLIATDISGRIIWSTEINTPQGQRIWDLRSTAPGTYTVSLQVGQRTLASQRLVH